MKSEKAVFVGQDSSYLGTRPRGLALCAVLRFLLVLVGTAVLAASRAQAQGNEGVWSTPRKLFEGDGYIQEPVILSDSTGMVHALWSVRTLSEGDLLYCAFWDGAGWTAPVDVIAAESITWPSATIDPGGCLHVVWHGVGDQLYYSSVPATETLSARRWSAPVAMGTAGNRAHIVADSQGRLHLGYSDRGEGGGARYARSTDGGTSWSQDVLVSFPSGSRNMADNVRLAIASEGTIHVAWTEWDLSTDGGPAGVFYAQSTDGGVSWSSPLQMAGEGYDEINVATAGEGEVHVAWNGAASIGGRYHSWSSDGGATWSDVAVISPPSAGGGSTGPPGLVVDGAGVVHAVVNTGGGDDKATQYSHWSGERWSPLVNVSQGVPGYLGDTNEESAITLVEGNRLFVVFRENGLHRLWVTTCRTSAPVVPPKPFWTGDAGTAAPTSTRGVEPSPSQPQKPQATRDLSSLSVRGTRSVGRGAYGAGAVVLLSGLSAFALVAAVLVIRLGASKRG